MGSAVRLVNGGTIQVRTGVLAGVGPEGPRGPVGPPGNDGAQGPLGEPGPIGQITQFQSRATVSSSITMLPDTSTLLSFPTVAYDDIAVFSSTTGLKFSRPGDYFVNVWARWALGSNPGDSYRMVFIYRRSLDNTAPLDNAYSVQSVRAVDDDFTHTNVTFPIRTTNVDEEWSIYGRSSDDVSLVIDRGAVTVTRIGSGPPGPTGPEGKQGIPGPQGNPGAQGLSGNANSGYTTYDALDG